MAARKFASVKFTDAFVEEARREAELFNRSVAGQIEHWARIGRALEGAPGVSTNRIKQTLDGKLKLEDLTLEENDAVMKVWLDTPSDEEIVAYAELGKRPGAIGTDEKGRLVVNRTKTRLKAVG